MREKKVLIIDHDTSALQLISLIFKRAGAQVVTAQDGLEGISKLFTENPDLITLAVLLPGANGYEVCRRIRQVSQTPIIIVTSLKEETDMIRGLEAGADDFLTKPFSPEILLARAQSIMRRYAAEQREPASIQDHNFQYNDGHLDIDVERRSILVRNRRVSLTPIEFRLLVYLARNAGKALTFNQILAHVWGEEYRGSIEHVQVYISQLRRKLEEDTRSPRYIVTLRGVGYIFEKQDLLYRP